MIPRRVPCRDDRSHGFLAPARDPARSHRPRRAGGMALGPDGIGLFIFVFLFTSGQPARHGPRDDPGRHYRPRCWRPQAASSPSCASRRGFSAAIPAGSPCSRPSSPTRSCSPPVLSTIYALLPGSPRWRARPASVPSAHSISVIASQQGLIASPVSAVTAALVVTLAGAAGLPRSSSSSSRRRSASRPGRCPSPFGGRSCGRSRLQGEARPGQGERRRRAARPRGRGAPARAHRVCGLSWPPSSRSC